MVFNNVILKLDCSGPQGSLGKTMVNSPQSPKMALPYVFSGPRGPQCFLAVPAKMGFSPEKIEVLGTGFHLHQHGRKKIVH